MTLSRNLGVFLGITALAPNTLAAQYTLTPSPPLDFTRLSTTLRLAGYVAVRAAVRSDTTTFSVTRARLTAEVQPFAVAALRVQTDFAAIGRTTVDTVPSFTLADAYVQISPPESSSYYRLPPVLRLAAAGKWLAHGSDHRWGADVRSEKRAASAAHPAVLARERC